MSTDIQQTEAPQLPTANEVFCLSCGGAMKYQTDYSQEGELEQAWFECEPCGVQEPDLHDCIVAPDFSCEPAESLRKKT